MSVRNRSSGPRRQCSQVNSQQRTSIGCGALASLNAGITFAQRSCEVGIRVTSLVDGRAAITVVVEVGMTGIEAVKLGDHREFSVSTSQGRIAGYRITSLSL